MKQKSVIAIINRRTHQLVGFKTELNWTSSNTLNIGLAFDLYKHFVAYEIIKQWNTIDKEFVYQIWSMEIWN